MAAAVPHATFGLFCENQPIGQATFGLFCDGVILPDHGAGSKGRRPYEKPYEPYLEQAMREDEEILLLIQAYFQTKDM